MSKLRTITAAALVGGLMLLVDSAGAQDPPAAWFDENTGQPYHPILIIGNGCIDDDGPGEVAISLVTDGFQRDLTARVSDGGNWSIQHSGGGMPEGLYEGHFTCNLATTSFDYPVDTFVMTYPTDGTTTTSPGTTTTEPGATTTTEPGATTTEPGATTTTRPGEAGTEEETDGAGEQSGVAPSADPAAPAAPVSAEPSYTG